MPPQEPATRIWFARDGAEAGEEIEIRRLVIAGWTGRDPAAVQQHIRELQELGVAAPSSVPLFYRVSASRLTTGPAVEVCGDLSSGEVEFVLVQSGGRLHVGVGSDHTDRDMETSNVALAKQLCDKPIAPALWDFSEVERHWDGLVLRSWIVERGDRVLYQEGLVSGLRAPRDLIERFTGGAPLPDGTVMFGGTLPAKGGVRPATRFEFEIEDPVRARRIRHGYDIVTLPVVA